MIRMSPVGQPRLAVAVSLWALTLAMNVAWLWTVVSTDLMAAMDATDAEEFSALDVAASYLVVGATAAVTTSYVSVGVLLANRPGAGRIAALMLAGGTLLSAVSLAYIVGDQLVSSRAAPIPSNALFLLGPLLDAFGFALILPGLALTFPDGHLPSRKLRLPVAIAIGLLACGTLLALVAPGEINLASGSSNPFGIAWLSHDLAGLSQILDGVGLLAIIVLGVVAVVLRYRAGSSLVRTQLRWFLAAVLLAAGPLAIFALSNAGGLYWVLVSMVGLLLVPVSIGIAIRRHGLYEIDRIISRTLAYAVLAAILAGVYLAAFLGLQALLARFTNGGGSIAVAASTLAVFALFQPVRRRIQGVVDRRFNRSQYDAAREIDGFAARVRDEVEVDRLTVALASTLERTMQPASASIWIRNR